MFVYDTEGNISSGAVAMAALDNTGQAVVISPTDNTEPPLTDLEQLKFLPQKLPRLTHKIMLMRFGYLT